ncbi:MAG TPA: hypothetical protein DCZ94_19415 [Lentisphaeria bacterium]|nr:hypothetical protein [Lentisphaeria bacterium]
MSAGILQAQERPTIPKPAPLPTPISNQKAEQKPAADQNVQKQDAPKIKDYSAGFEKFYKLGLPDASTAKYVKLDLYSSFGPSSMYGYQLRSMGVTGNAWMLKEDKTGKSLFIVDNIRLVEVYDYEALSKIKAKELEEKAKKDADKGRKQSAARAFSLMEDDGRVSGKWGDADLKKDIAKILEYLNKKKDGAEGGNRNFEYDQLSNECGYGVVLLYAIHAYKKGFKDEANQIAGKLFERAKEPQKVIAQGMTVLADGRYNDIMDKFFASGDWNSLGKDLDGLLSTFSSGWRNAGAVKKLAENVKKRAETAAPPELKGPGLADEDKKLALEIAGADTPKVNRFRYNRELWIMHAGKSPRVKLESESITDKITARGMKSVPLLLALLKDDYLTKIDLGRIRGYSYVSHNYDSNSSAEERNNEIYQQMRRPATRADFASTLLSPILPNQNDYEARKEGPEGMFDACSEWYEENKDKTPIELAKAYMSDENSQRKNEAVAFLIKNGSEEDIKGLEKQLLDSETSDYSVLQLAQQYAEKRGDKAKDFVEKFTRKLEEAKPEEGENEPGGEHMKKYKADMIKRFKDAVSSTTAQEIINDILSGKKTFDESTMQLSQKLRRETKENSEKIILTAALNAKEPELSMRFMSFSSMRPMVSFDMDDDSEEGGEEAETEKTLGNVELWKKLLADGRKMALPGIDSKMTVGDSAAINLDSEYGKVSGMERNRAFMILGTERVMPIVRSRVAKILEGKKDIELPVYPDPKNIADDKRQKLIAELKASSEPDKALSKLSNDELMAVVEEIDKKPDDFTVLFKTADKVGKVESEINGIGKIDELKGAEGKLLDKAVVEKMLAICKDMAAKGVDMKALIVRKPCLEGVHISFVKVDAKTYIVTALGQKGWEAMVSCFLSAPGMKAGYASATWPVDQQEKNVKEKKKKGDLLEEALDEVETDVKDAASAKRDEFWKKIDEFCAGKGNPLRNAVIMFSAVSARKQQEPEKKPDAAAAEPVKKNVE